MLARTGSAVLAGATAAAAVLLGALAGPVLGAWLDVARRRRVLIVFDQLTSVVALLAMVALAVHGLRRTDRSIRRPAQVSASGSSGSPRSHSAGSRAAG